jgi:23S rRNA (pseudouridine1915-N3)-methyltransferase
MNITIITVGKMKGDFLRSGVDEYAKRLKHYCNLEMIEVPDEKIPDHANMVVKEQIKNKEGLRIIEKIPKRSLVITLEIEGRQITSEEFAKKIEDYAVRGRSQLTFIIGGSLGLSDNVKSMANWHLSFSKMTFPHQLFRIMLLEQIYRSYKINRNETYHK